MFCCVCVFFIEFQMLQSRGWFGFNLKCAFFFYCLIGNILKFEFRPLPPLPDLNVFEESFLAIAEVLCVWGNRGLSIACDIAIGGDLKVLLQVYYLILTYIQMNQIFKFQFVLISCLYINTMWIGLSGCL